jgi:hypothetical protein
MGKKAVVLVFILCCHVMGQKVSSSKNVLIRTFSTGDFQNAVSDAAFYLREIVDKSEGKIAVRICTTEPMPVALAVATGRPFLLQFLLESHGYSSERLFFLRYKNCNYNKPDIAITEFWSVPNGEQLPLSDESILATKASIKEYPSNGKARQQAVFRKNLLALINDMNKSPNSFGVIVGYYNKHPGAALKRNSRFAESFLRNKDAVAGRVYTRLLPWIGTSDSNDKEPQFPVIILVNVKE